MASHGVTNAPSLEIRAITAEDAIAIADAFAKVGWANKSVEQYLRYADLHAKDERQCWLAFADGRFAGYLCIVWTPTYKPLADNGIPEIQDMNVLPDFRRRGIANALMDQAEGIVAERSPVIGIGVGLHAGYGHAQRIYVKRGYVPDGLGVSYSDKIVPEGETVRLDDDLNLYFTKQLR